MEANRVLSSFMDLNTDGRDFFRYNLASNAVLEWFGRTIRGNEQIEQFLRYDVWPQYEQNFVSASVCSPFETKPSHEQTKNTPIENKNSRQKPCQSKATDGFESPPPTKRDLTIPPPLIRRKNRIRTRTTDDSARSSDSDGGEITTTTTSERYNLRRLVGNRDDQQERRTLRKRTVEETRASELRNRSPTKRTKKTTTTTTNEPCPGPSLEKCSTSTTACTSDYKPYSELHYLESIGSIRTIRRAKNPNINKIPTQIQTATPFVSPESQNGWDRKTKLKISYRISSTNENDIQFALIIYEPMTMLTRRNLLEEFQKAALEEEQQRTQLQTSSPIVPLPATPIDTINRNGLLKTPLDKIKHKIEKPLTLRRLRF